MMNGEKLEKDNSSVKVAIRIRPLVDGELARKSENVLDVYKALQQIRILRSEKAFTFNYVADPETDQQSFYDSTVKNMITNLFKGYNMTILAYGQTGSGKTHSMGTAYKGEGDMGVIPRAVHDIFNYVEDNFVYDFNITVSFMELYQETLYDLLSSKSRDQSVIEIREDLKGIILPGLTEEPVTNATKTLECLIRGSMGRATSSTNMNAQSSRSHAIFTLNIFMQRKDNCNVNKTAKFHLVDLAGSERSKKTGATGVTFKEGININKGLLALGNVISALGDEKQQGYIGYRDSNLTRLLKDSLGGNSITLMIACVSPADYNLDETLSTLRYADRARKIKNKPIINEDPKTAEINRLNKLVSQLRLELLGQGGPVICQAEINEIRNENLSLKNKNRELTLQLSTTLNENTLLFERIMMMQNANECMSKKIFELKDCYNITLDNLNLSIEQNNLEAIKDHIATLNTMQDAFKDLNHDIKKAEDEVRQHERCSNATSLINVNLATESEINEKQESRTVQQMNMYLQLQEITKSLAMKEDLAQQILSQNYGQVNHAMLKDNESKIRTLEEEKEKLLQQLKVTQEHGTNSKIAEQRRKQIKELEKEIDDLKKKIKEQSQLLRLKESDELKIKKLNGEIHQMKITKVNLIKNMRQESEKFRTWKLQREKELIKLKDQERKRQNQIVKMESLHERQQNVLKRKVEEASALNKRLKDMLALRKNVQDQKNNGKIERLGPWIQQELEVFVNTVEAEATINYLLEDKATLLQQLEVLKANSDVDEIQNIEDEISLRTTQINELRQKVLDYNIENKTKTRWDNIQTMADAKYCLKSLFELTADIRRKDVNSENKCNDLKNAQTDMLQRLNEQEKEMKLMKTDFQQEIFNIKTEYEDKIAILLRQLRGVPLEDQDLQERYQMQEKLVEKIEKEFESYKLESKKREAILKGNYEQIKTTLEEIKHANPSESFMTHKPMQKVKKHNLASSLSATYEKLDEMEIDSSIDDDDTLADPDWRKTPLGKRIQKLREAQLAITEVERESVKRNSEGSCTCKGNCSRRSCGCKKFSKLCGSLCRCVEEICQNRKAENKENLENESQSSTIIDETFSFKKPRTGQRNTDAHSRTAKQLFNLEIG